MDQTEKIAQLVENPSLGAVTYQAFHLAEQIRKLDLDRQPAELLKIRNLLLCLTEQLLDKLWELYDAKQPLSAKGVKGFYHTRSLAEALRAVYSFIRYICEDDFRQRPPSLHFIITELAYHHFPRANGEPLCMVRTQWHYNNKCVTLSDEIKEILPLFAFEDQIDTDPNEAAQPDVTILNWWTQWVEKLTADERQVLKPDSQPPLQVGVLSFGGLDDRDVFLYPLLAHEIGHFIDSSYSTALHLSVPIEKGDWPSEEQLREYFLGAGHELRDDQIDRYFDELTEITYTCVREVFADLLGVRILGFGYFVSLAEYLKTMYSWSQWAIDQENGYPGIGVRLWFTFRHLTAPSGLDFTSFVKSAAATEPEIAEFVLKYLGDWKAFLDRYFESLHIDSIEPHYDALNSNDTPITQLALRALLTSVDEIDGLANRALPEPTQLNNTLFERVHKLEKNQPPHLDGDTALSFAEVMAAAWIYEFMSGEDREIDRTTIEEQYSEYANTSEKILETMNRILDSSGRETLIEMKEKLSDLEKPVSSGIQQTTNEDTTLQNAREKLGSLYDTVLEGYKDEYKDIADTWRSLETKAQGTVAIAGIFAAAAFAFTRELSGSATLLDRWFLVITVVSLTISVIVSVLALLVRGTTSPPFGEASENLVRDLVLNEFPDAELVQRLSNLDQQNASRWRTANEEALQLNRQKARLLLIAQCFLVIAIVTVGTITVTRVVNPQPTQITQEKK